MKVFAEVCAIFGAMIGLASVWRLVRRRWEAQGASPDRLHRLDLGALILALATLGLSRFMPAEFLSDTSAPLLLMFIAVLGTVIVVPKEIVTSPVAKFVLAALLLLARRWVFEYAASRGDLFDILLHLIYVSLLAWLIFTATGFILRNMRLPNGTGGWSQR